MSKKIPMRVINRPGTKGWRPKVRFNRRYKASGMRSAKTQGKNRE